MPQSATEAEHQAADPRPVVVGVDEFGHSNAALRWAADLAARERRPLILVHAWTWPFFQVLLDGIDGDPGRMPPEAQVRELLEDARATARERQPDIEIDVDLPIATTATALGLQTQTAAIVVVGSDNYGELGALALGSVGIRLTARALCPIAVIRGSVTEDGPVVVGIEDVLTAAPMIRYAATEAEQSSAPLHLLHVSQTNHDQCSDEILRELLTETLPEATHLRIDCAMTAGRPGHALVAASVGARLVVVGAHGPGGFRELAPGSASHYLIHHSHCPVVIVPRTT